MSEKLPNFSAEVELRAKAMEKSRTVESVIRAVDFCRRGWIELAEGSLRVGNPEEAAWKIERVAELGVAIEILEKCQRHVATVFPLLKQADAKLEQERQAKEVRAARNAENRKRWAQKRQAQ